MTNSQKIWIGYAFIPFALTSLYLPPIVLSTFGAPDDTAMIGAFTGLLSFFAVWVAYSRSSWIKCWRCAAPLSRASNGWYMPLVLWRHCPTCGVRHAANPEDVRRNPIGHFREH